MDEDPQGAQAFEDLDEGIGRRTLLKAAAAIGTGAVAPAWALGSGCGGAAQDTGPGAGPKVLQSGQGPHAKAYVTSTPETIHWGILPNRDVTPVGTVRSGTAVTFDTVSHEGILEDQGRDPVAYFASKKVAERDVLNDARAIAGSDLDHDFVKDGPHVVTGPVDVAGARPGDVLRVDVVELTPRVPYGVISNRHGKGALPDEYPLGPGPQPGASAQRPELYNNVSTFTSVRAVRRARHRAAGRRAHARGIPHRSVHGDHGRRDRHVGARELDPPDGRLAATSTSATSRSARRCTCPSS